MTDGEALYQAILADPDDDAVRLAYADWLDEHGDTDRAEFIRVEIQLHSLPVDDPQYKPLNMRRREIRNRHGESWARPLLEAAAEGWRPLGGWLSRLVRFVRRDRPLPLVSWNYFRGFVELVFFRGSAFPTYARNLGRLTPIRMMSVFGGRLDQFAAVAEFPYFHRLITLHLEFPELDETLLVRLLGSDSFRRLQLLALQGAGLTAWVCRSVAQSPSLGSLESLTIGRSEIGTAGAQALADSPYLTAVKYLGLFDTGIGDDGLRALAFSSAMSNLVLLTLEDESISPEGVEILVRSPRLTKLKLLRVATVLDEPVAAALREKYPQAEIRFGPEEMLPLPPDFDSDF